MSIGGVNGVISNQMFLPSVQKTREQIPPQVHPAKTQGAAEESQESIAEKRKESQQKNQTTKPQSINLYA